ncbi:hypothetical protein [Streptomyces sp. NPDC055134]
MSTWDPGGQPPYDPQAGHRPGPYPPPPPNGGYPPPPNGGHPPRIPYPYGPPPNGPYPYPPHPGPPPAPGPFQRLRRKVGPIHTARRVFKPSRSGIVDDALVARIQKMRTLVGLGAVVWVSMSYKLANSMSDVASERADQAWISVLMLSVTFPVAWAYCSPSPRPRRAASCCAGPPSRSAR